MNSKLGQLILMFLTRLGLGAENHEVSRRHQDEIKGISSICNDSIFHVSLETKTNFTGSIYARGYPMECRAEGKGRQITTLSLSPQECGVRIIQNAGGKHTYDVLLYVQFDPQVQQVSDQQIPVTCEFEKHRDLQRIGGARSHVSLRRLKIDKKQGKTSSVSKELRSPKKTDLFAGRPYPLRSVLNITSKLQKMVNDYHRSANEKGKESPTSTPPPKRGTNYSLSSAVATSTINIKQGPISVATTSKPSVASTFNTPKSSPASLKPTNKHQLITTSKKLSTVLKFKEDPPNVEIFQPSLPMRSTTGGSKRRFSQNEWLPILPPKAKTPKIEQWKDLLGQDGNDEMVSGWMDIIKGESPHGVPVKNELLVGETATLVVRLNRLPGADARVTSCLAHDGSGVNGQELVDERGCSIDDSIMPSLRVLIDKDTKEEISYAPFKAFKFPDYDHLHLKCIVTICLNSCPKLDCDSPQKGVSDDSKSHQQEPQAAGSFFLIGQKSKKIFEATSSATRKKTNSKFGDTNVQDSVIDTIEVFNSVAVKAPGIETTPRMLTDLNDDYYNEIQDEHDKGVQEASPLKDDSMYCVSSTKLLTSFGILITILILAVLCAVYCCVKDRLRRSRISKEIAARRPTIPTLPRISHIPPARLHSVVDHSKYAYRSSPYHRFPH